MLLFWPSLHLSYQAVIARLRGLPLQAVLHVGTHVRHRLQCTCDLTRALRYPRVCHIPHALPRWALNNVVGQKTPPCKPFMQLITRDPAYIRRNAVDPRLTNASLYATVGISEGTGNGRNNTLCVLGVTGKGGRGPTA